MMPVLLSLGSVYAALGNRDSAQVCFQEVLALQRAAPDTGVAGQAVDYHKRSGFEQGLAGTWGQLGRAFLKAGNVTKAETCFNFSSSHFISLGDVAGEAEALRGLVSVYESRGDPELVRRCRERVAEIQTRYGLACPESPSA